MESRAGGGRLEARATGGAGSLAGGLQHGLVGQVDQALDLRLELAAPLLVMVGAARRALEPEQLVDVGPVVGEQAQVGPNAARSASSTAANHKPRGQSEQLST